MGDDSALGMQWHALRLELRVPRRGSATAAAQNEYQKPPAARTALRNALKTSLSRPREPGACTLCPSDPILLDSECLKSLREVSTTSSESSNVLKALRETVRQSQKSMKFHSKRLVLLTEDDLSGHVFCASKGPNSESRYGYNIRED